MPFLLLGLWTYSGYLGYKLGERKGIALIGLTMGVFLPVIGHLVLLIETPGHGMVRARWCRYCKTPVGQYAIRCHNCWSQFNNPGSHGEAFLDPDRPLVGPTQDGWYADWDEHGITNKGDDWNG